jgi:hypothetical protein
VIRKEKEIAPISVMSPFAFPMARPLRRYVRISLRTLFVLTTVCALGLGYLSKCARDQRAAVQRIHELGGSVSYDFQYADGEANGKLLKNPQPPGWSWLRRLIGPEYFQDVVRASLDKKQVNDDDLRLIGKLTRLNTLGLNHTGVSDAGLKHLDELKRLCSLGLAETQITGAGLRVVSHFDNLDTLILQDASRIDDDCIQHVKSLTHLETLNLGGTSVSSTGVSQLAALNNLRWLYLSDTSVDDAAVEALISMRHLAELGLRGSQITGEGLLTVRAGLSSCEVQCDMIDLRRSNAFKAENAKKWDQLAARMRALNNEDRIKLIDLSDTQIVDEYLPSLYGLDNVEAIDFRNTQVTKAGVKRLERALPGCKCFY